MFLFHCPKYSVPLTKRNMPWGGGGLFVFAPIGLSKLRVSVSNLGCISLVQFSHSVVSDSLRPHGLQHARPPCPSPTPGVYQNPCPLSWWCHIPISSSVIPFSSCPQSFPAWGFFPELVLHIRWPNYWSFSFSISPSNEYSGLIFISIDWFDLHAVHGTLNSLLQHHNSKASMLWCSAFFIVQLSHQTWLLEKP